MKVFILYVSFLSLRIKIIIYLAQKAQKALLLANKVTVWVEYADFANVFFKKLAKLLPKWIDIIKYAIKLVDGK